MLGIADFWVAAAIILSLASAALCLLCGIAVKKQPPTETPEFKIGKETIFWAQTERQLEDEL